MCSIRSLKSKKILEIVQFLVLRLCLGYEVERFGKKVHKYFIEWIRI